MGLFGFPLFLGNVQVPSQRAGVSAPLGGWVGVVHGPRHIVAHGGPATLCRPVLLSNLVMAAKECECGMIITGQPLVPTGAASLLRTAAQGPSGAFTSMGNVGGRPSSVTPTGVYG